MYVYMYVYTYSVVSMVSTRVDPCRPVSEGGPAPRAGTAGGHRGRAPRAGTSVGVCWSVSMVSKSVQVSIGVDGVQLTLVSKCRDGAQNINRT